MSSRLGHNSRHIRTLATKVQSEFNSSTANDKPQSDRVLVGIAKYVHQEQDNLQLAFHTAKLCFLDTLGCGVAALKHKQVQDIIKPIVPGCQRITHGVKVLGTPYQMDPVSGAFAFGTLFRWLGYNDCWSAAEWGHPSDNLGGILAVADYLNRLHRGTNGAEGRIFTIKDILSYMIKAHEIQGIIALDNSFNKHGLDHVVLVKIATVAVVSKMIGLDFDQTIAAVSHGFADGAPLRVYRHAPNTGSRKSWAAGDATARAVKLAYMVKNSDIGSIPSVLTAKKWGFYDVLWGGQPFEFEHRNNYGSYVMENILFKVPYPAELHAQTAVEASFEAHRQLKVLGKSYKDIKSICIKTTDSAIKIIDKTGPLHNSADRDHCIQYMTAIPLIYGKLDVEHYSDEIAANPDIDNLRSKMKCEVVPEFNTQYRTSENGAIPNAISIELLDGSKIPEIRVDIPVGHRERREEAIPLLKEKFRRNLIYGLGSNEDVVSRIINVSEDPGFSKMAVDEYLDLFHQPSPQKII